MKIEFTRANPHELSKFDPSTKICTMNCGPIAGDPRSNAERKLLCDDCQVIEKTQGGVMELTDEQIEEWRTFGRNTDMPEEEHDSWNALCDMALAYNAAKKAEPVAKIHFLLYGEPLINWRGSMPERPSDHVVFASLPDLEAKLREARGLLENWLEMELLGETIDKTRDFLARTK